MNDIPTFETKKELFKFLIENEKSLIAQKKATMKKADGFAFNGDVLAPVNKANNPIENAPDVLKVEAIINTTNVIDSHKDVHLPGLWDKSLKENKNIMHLQEHKMNFTSIIADGKDLTAKAETVSWKELGFDFEGETQALVFESNVSRKRNKYMHEQYAEGHVKNHSVGMQYVKLALAINDEDEGSYYEVWTKYIDQIANKEAAIDAGYFWAVKEAKVIEGSAVPIGSNQFTPTLNNNKKPPDGTSKDEPLNALSADKLLKHFKL